MAKKKVKKADNEGPTFEQALLELEGIVHDLEEGELGLNEALVRYEQGVKLLRQSYNLLEGAERRIELLSGVDADGNPTTGPFDDTSTLSGENPTGQTPTSTPHETGSTKQKPRKPRGDAGEIDTPGGLF